MSEGAPDITDKDKKLRGRRTSSTLCEAKDAMVADNGDHSFGLDAEGRERRLTSVNTTEMSCPDGVKQFMLSLKTDQYPQDTSWTLIQPMLSLEVEIILTTAQSIFRGIVYKQAITSSLFR